MKFAAHGPYPAQKQPPRGNWIYVTKNVEYTCGVYIHVCLTYIRFKMWSTSGRILIWYYLPDCIQKMMHFIKTWGNPGTPNVKWKCMKHISRMSVIEDLSSIFTLSFTVLWFLCMREILKIKWVKVHKAPTENAAPETPRQSSSSRFVTFCDIPMTHFCIVFCLAASFAFKYRCSTAALSLLALLAQVCIKHVYLL